MVRGVAAATTIRHSAVSGDSATIVPVETRFLQLRSAFGAPCSQAPSTRRGPDPIGPGIENARIEQSGRSS
jgi:hypothetical protein